MIGSRECRSSTLLTGWLPDTGFDSGSSQITPGIEGQEKFFQTRVGLEFLMLLQETFPPPAVAPQLECLCPP